MNKIKGVILFVFLAETEEHEYNKMAEAMIVK